MNISKTSVRLQISRLLSDVSSSSFEDVLFATFTAGGKLSILSGLDLLEGENFYQINDEIHFRFLAVRGLAS